MMSNKGEKNSARQMQVQQYTKSEKKTILFTTLFSDGIMAPSRLFDHHIFPFSADITSCTCTSNSRCVCRWPLTHKYARYLSFQTHLKNPETNATYVSKTGEYQAPRTQYYVNTLLFCTFPNPPRTVFSVLYMTIERDSAMMSNKGDKTVHGRCKIDSQDGERRFKHMELISW